MAGMLLGASVAQAQFDAPAAEQKSDAAQAAPAAPAPNDDANPFDSQTPPAPQTAPVPRTPAIDPAPYSASPNTTPVAPAGPRVEIDPFLPPAGMTMSPECLIEAMGFYGHRPFVYSASNCFDLASACYKYGYYEDAIALLSHAIEQEPTARYYYLRGMSQMKAGLSYDAAESADGVWTAQSAGHTAGLDRVRERFNGPLAVQFRELLKLRQPTTDGRSS